MGSKRKKRNLVEVHDDDDRKIPALVMWYLLVFDRLRRLFANPKVAELMTWHKWPGDDKMHHPADGSQWKKFDSNDKEFADQPRNIRFALSTDGMNPFGETRNPHNTCQ